MGRMNEALRKAAEERERKRRQKSRDSDTATTATPTVPRETAPNEAVTVEGRRADPPAQETVRPEPAAPAAPAEPRPAARVVEPPAPAAPETPAEPARPAATEPAEPAADDLSLAARAREKARRERVREEAAPAAPRPAPEPVRPTARQGVDDRVICYHSPRDPRSEQMRGIRTTLLTMDSQPKSVAITSGSPDEGKSLACVNLASSLVEGGTRRVLLVDANLRYPQLVGILGALDAAGLSDLMHGVVSDPKSLIQETGIPNVDLLTAGQSLDNPGSLLNPKALAGVLGLVEDDYDFVIVDTPALDEYADAAVMAPEVDGAILVCQVEGPPRSAAEKALDLLESARARILGLMATNCR